MENMFLSLLQDKVERMCEDCEEGEIDEVCNEPGPPAAQSSPRNCQQANQRRKPTAILVDRRGYPPVGLGGRPLEAPEGIGVRFRGGKASTEGPGITGGPAMSTTVLTIGTREEDDLQQMDTGETSENFQGTVGTIGSVDIL